MLHFGLPAADIITHPTQPFALNHLHVAGSDSILPPRRKGRAAIMANRLRNDSALSAA
jgi:hypothetical protein